MKTELIIEASRHFPNELIVTLKRKTSSKTTAFEMYLKREGLEDEWVKSRVVVNKRVTNRGTIYEDKYFYFK